KLDIEMLLVILARSDYSALKNANPTLSEDEVKALMQDVANYAVAKSEWQQMVRAESSLKDYAELLESKASDIVLELASNEYVETAGAVRTFNPSERPRLLIFEVLGNIMLRKNQAEALDAKTLEGRLEAWKLFEAGTGFGKSKVLLPLWLLL